jgi:hypothetical protein
MTILINSRSGDPATLEDAQRVEKSQLKDRTELRGTIILRVNLTENRGSLPTTNDCALRKDHPNFNLGAQPHDSLNGSPHLREFCGRVHQCTVLVGGPDVPVIQ